MRSKKARLPKRRQYNLNRGELSLLIDYPLRYIFIDDYSLEAYKAIRPNRNAAGDRERLYI